MLIIITVTSEWWYPYNKLVQKYTKTPTVLLCAHESVSVCVCVSACVCACVCACVRVRERERLTSHRLRLPSCCPL